jgi:hypothetical protein
MLLLHQNFSGQLGHLVREWNARPSWDVRPLDRSTPPGKPGFDRLVRYKLVRSPHAQQNPYLRTTFGLLWRQA